MSRPLIQGGTEGGALQGFTKYELTLVNLAGILSWSPMIWSHHMSVASFHLPKAALPSQPPYYLPWPVILL